MLKAVRYGHFANHVTCGLQTCIWIHFSGRLYLSRGIITECTKTVSAAINHSIKKSISVPPKTPCCDVFAKRETSSPMYSLFGLSALRAGPKQSFHVPNAAPSAAESVSYCSSIIVVFHLSVMRCIVVTHGGFHDVIFAGRNLQGPANQ